MAAPDSTLRIDWLLRATRYDPETGEVFWVNDVLGGVAGRPIPQRSVKGYRRVVILGRNVYVHRLAWLHMTGRWPTMIDHISGDRADNRWSNLREATHQQNMQNRRQAQRNSRSGLLGVGKRAHGKTYYVRLQHNGSTIRVGGLQTADDARRAYLALKREFHEACTI